MQHPLLLNLSADELRFYRKELKRKIKVWIDVRKDYQAPEHAGHHDNCTEKIIDLEVAKDLLDLEISRRLSLIFEMTLTQVDAATWRDKMEMNESHG